MESNPTVRQQVTGRAHSAHCDPHLLQDNELTKIIFHGHFHSTISFNVLIYNGETITYPKIRHNSQFISSYFLKPNFKIHVSRQK